MLWPFITRAHTRCRPFLVNQKQFLSFDVGGVTHSPACFSMKAVGWAGGIRPELIYVLSACTRVIYADSRQGCWSGLLVHLHAQTPFATLVDVSWRKNFMLEFCYTTGNHGSVWAKFRSPSKTTKRIQILIGLPERALKFSYWKNQLSTWTLLLKLTWRRACPNWPMVTWAGFTHSQ